MTDPIITKDNGLGSITWCNTCKSFVYKEKLLGNLCISCYVRERMTREIDEMKDSIIDAVSVEYDISRHVVANRVDEQLNEIAKEIIKDGDK